MLNQKLSDTTSAQSEKNLIQKDEKTSIGCFSSFFKKIKSCLDETCKPTPQDPNVYSTGCFGTPKHHDSHPGSHYYYMTHRQRSP